MLNPFGKLAVVEIIFYAPILCFSFFVTLRYGFRRGEGWISLFIFASGVQFVCFILFPGDF